MRVRNRHWLQQQLLDWYQSNQRDLPWRRTKDPYAIWISEVMLQQTQAQTVIPFYLNFLKIFPDVKTLAMAKPDRLLRAWAGLGYYSRVRALQRAAQRIVQDHCGEFPRDFQRVLGLPGIGRYTAGAILSIAFDQPYPVVDGNVTRVLCRVFKLRGDPKGSLVQKRLWEFSSGLLPAQSPGDFNQAMMELGATLCLPRDPYCLLCPWQTVCLARKAGIQKELPEKKRSLSPIKSLRAVAIIRHRDRILVTRRVGERVLDGFWDFPGAEFTEEKNLESALVRQIEQEFGLRVQLSSIFLTIVHSITRRRITLHAFLADLKGKLSHSKDSRNIRWIRLQEADRYPFGSASKRIVKALKEKNREVQERGVKRGK